jgi:hypothetical protein
MGPWAFLVQADSCTQKGERKKRTTVRMLKKEGRTNKTQE